MKAKDLAMEFVRRLHQVAGLSLLVFVLMHFLTGALLVHEGWLPRGTEAAAEVEVRLPAGAGMTPAEVAAVLRADHGVRGQPVEPRELPDGRWEHRFFRPGEVTRVVHEPVSGRLAITREAMKPGQTLVALHRLHHYRGAAVYLVWAFAMDLASASLLVFAVTGVVLWYRLERGRRWIGVVVLVVAYGYLAGMVLYQMLRR